MMRASQPMAAVVSFVSLLALASALLTIRAGYKGTRRQVYFFKPLTVILILFVALQSKHATAPSYQGLIVAGLLCSLAGDLFLMLPRERFVAGLVCFLLAHVCYVAAFTSGVARAFAGGGSLVFTAWGGAALFVYGALMLMLLWPGLGKLKAPVAVYVAVILLMAWQALNRCWGTLAGGSEFAAAGALLFVASDSALAWNRFRSEFRSAQAVVLGTYFAAQWLIALST